jgi:diguanylate cyclase (GGDEF)-like protein
MPNEEKLSDVLGEFARTMVTDFPIQAILDHLVERIVDVLPITAAGVTLISPTTNPRYVAASDDSALRYEQLQTELGEGPCLLAYQTGLAVAVSDLRDAPEFPRFAPEAVVAGLMAVFTFPLRNRGEQLGALDLYRDTPGPMDPGAMQAAQTLADVAAAYLINAQARTELRDASDRSNDRALHDALTGLPNRTLLLEHLDQAVLRARRSGKLAAVLFADLDGFKQVNDQHGHRAGDELLVGVAKRLSETLRPGDTLARISGDEFVVLCEDLGGPEEADVIAARVGAAIAAPFVLSMAEVTTTASVGIAFSGPAEELSEQMLVDADTAMYQAKHRGGARHQVIDLREQHLAGQRAHLARDLQTALAHGELRNEYQPIVDTDTQRVVGVEALLRWDHPARGLVAPSVLIPLTEQSGLILTIGQWVLQQACADRHRWPGSGPAEAFGMSVNVSAHQIMAPDLVRVVAEVLDKSGTDPAGLTLEVTETAFVQDSERALVVLRDIKRLGVRLALDDFGTGYSSLSYLKRFPIDLVKIDQGFIADIDRDRTSGPIVAAITELAHILGMIVVAEGVETPEQHKYLTALGCDRCQGFYFARPMPADDLDRLLQGGDELGAVRLSVAQGND